MPRTPARPIRYSRRVVTLLDVQLRTGCGNGPVDGRDKPTSLRVLGFRNFASKLVFSIFQIFHFPRQRNGYFTHVTDRVRVIYGITSFLAFNFLTARTGRIAQSCDNHNPTMASTKSSRFDYVKSLPLEVIRNQFTDSTAFGYKGQ
jgi:hypothetical protein